MKISQLLPRFFITRKCLICNEPISYDEEKPFCKNCMPQWKMLLELKCHRCGRKNDECTCLPSQIRESSKYGATWCVFYDNHSKLVANNLVFKLKREYNRGIITFFASEMAKNLKSLTIRNGINYKDAIITYAPRRKKGRYYYGFDHSKKLALSLGKILGVKVKRMLINKGKKAQKLLTKEKRRENAIVSYKTIKRLNIKDKTIFLVDDIITSGSTMKACADLLYNRGAKTVLPVAYAKDNR